MICQLQAIHDVQLLSNAMTSFYNMVAMTITQMVGMSYCVIDALGFVSEEWDFWVKLAEMQIHLLARSGGRPERSSRCQ